MRATALTDVGGFGLALAWKQKIGIGYSGLSIVNGVAVTMFEDNDANVVAAFDAETGVPRWRTEIEATYPRGATFEGPISTPLVSDDVVIAVGRWGRLVCLDLQTGELRWSVNAPEELGAHPPNNGFGTSPILLNGTAIVQVGGTDAAVAAFDLETGARRWTAGADLTQYQNPVPMTLSGRPQVVMAGTRHVMGLDPDTGTVLWQYDHGGSAWTGVDSLVPVAAGPNRVFLAHSDASSMVVELEDTPRGTMARELWQQRSIRNSYNVPVFHEGYLYGYNTRILVCVDAASGELVWRSRAPGDGFLIFVDGHLVLLTKDGNLHIIEASPRGYAEVASLELFDELVWTPPSFANGQIYARSLTEMARVDVRSVVATNTDRRADSASAPVDSETGMFAQFLQAVDAAPDRASIVERFLRSLDEFPLIEDDTTVHFLYHGGAGDVGIAGDMVGARRQQPMTRVADTNLFYYSTELARDARVNYYFIRDYTQPITDPRNPRTTTTTMYDYEMEVQVLGGAEIPMSWLAMPDWRPALHLIARPDRPHGRLVAHRLDSARREDGISLQVYLPFGYDEAPPDRRYPVAYYHGLAGPLEQGHVTTSLDNLIGTEVEPLIAVFVDFPLTEAATQVRLWRENVVPFIDSTYQTDPVREARASIGNGYRGVTALVAAFSHADLVGKVATQSPALLVLSARRRNVEQLAEQAAPIPMTIHMEWGQYDVRAPHEPWDLRESAAAVMTRFAELGYGVEGGQVPDGTGWSSWQYGTDRVLRTLFPLP